ncbi:hypothetical protein, partial [Ralstonia sp.]|uniref:hypothetical protein n=1 Tax=Ralstonia sp. TaxID=54061 RepID=UPI00257C92C4
MPKAATSAKNGCISLHPVINNAKTMTQHTSQANALNRKSGSQWPDLTFDAVDRVLTLSGGWTGNQRNGHYSTMHHLSRVLIELYRSAPSGSARQKKLL